MPWTHSDYPPSMKNMDRVIRNKAVDIANALLEDGFEEGSAIAIATSRAQQWADGRDLEDEEDTATDFVVSPQSGGWEVRRISSEGVASVFPTMEAARNFAVEQAEAHGVNVVIHDANGQVEDFVSLVDQVIPASNRVDTEPDLSDVEEST